MDASTVTSKGQVTIPKEVRRALGIRQGSRIAFTTKNGKAELRVLHRAPETVVSGHGMLDARGKHMPVDFDVASLLAPKLTPKRGGKR
jgi:AbrB family looped-hinge helix DNA binding protein